MIFMCKGNYHLTYLRHAEDCDTAFQILDYYVLPAISPHDLSDGGIRAQDAIFVDYCDRFASSLQIVIPGAPIAAPWARYITLREGKIK